MRVVVSEMTDMALKQYEYERSRRNNSGSDRDYLKMVSELKEASRKDRMRLGAFGFLRSTGFINNDDDYVDVLVPPQLNLKVMEMYNWHVYQPFGKTEIHLSQPTEEAYNVLFDIFKRYYNYDVTKLNARAFEVTIKKYSNLSLQTGVLCALYWAMKDDDTKMKGKLKTFHSNRYQNNSTPHEQHTKDCYEYVMKKDPSSTMLGTVVSRLKKLQPAPEEIRLTYSLANALNK